MQGRPQDAAATEAELHAPRESLLCAQKLWLSLLLGVRGCAHRGQPSASLRHGAHLGSCLQVPLECSADLCCPHSPSEGLTPQGELSAEAWKREVHRGCGGKLCKEAVRRAGPHTAHTPTRPPREQSPALPRCPARLEEVPEGRHISDMVTAPRNSPCRGQARRPITKVYLRACSPVSEKHISHQRLPPNPKLLQEV